MAKLNAASFFGTNIQSQNIVSEGSSATQTAPTSSFNSSQLIQIIKEYQSILTDNRERTKVDVSLMSSIRELMSSMSLITSNLNSLKKTVVDHLKSHSSLLRTKKPKPSYSSDTETDRPGGWSKSPERVSSLSSPLGDMSKTAGLIAAATAGITAAIGSLQFGDGSNGDAPDVSSAPGEQKLAAFIATIEASGDQNQADVLQSMYNRAGQNYSGYGGLFGQLTAPNQYSPLSAAIHGTTDPAAQRKFGPVANKLGKTPSERIEKLREIISKPDALNQLQTLFGDGSASNAAIILDDALKGGTLSKKSKDFIKGRTDFGDKPGNGGASGQTINRGRGGNYFGENGSNIPASPPPASPNNLQASATPDLSGEDVRVALSPTSLSTAEVKPEERMVPDLTMDATKQGDGQPPILIYQASPTPRMQPQLQAQNSGTIQPTDPYGSSIPGALCLGSYCALS